MDLMKMAVAYLVARLGESSTWSAILGWIATELGLHLNPDFNGWLVQLGVMLAAGAGIIIKEGWQAKGAMKKDDTK